MLTLGILLLVVGLIVTVALPRAREIGIVAAIGGIILIVLAYWPDLTN